MDGYVWLFLSLSSATNSEPWKPETRINDLKTEFLSLHLDAICCLLLQPKQRIDRKNVHLFFISSWIHCKFWDYIKNRYLPLWNKTISKIDKINISYINIYLLIFKKVASSVSKNYIFNFLHVINYTS